jgi:adenine-specific DNA-methyltransferase
MQKTNIPQAESKSADLVAQNLEQLKQIFPEVIKEGRVDFEALNDLLGNYGDTAEERFCLNWAGKANARREAQKRSTGTLRPCPEESVDWDTTENLYIEGDNLEVLKLLQKSYHSRVKMIYIDPPYNTGKDFVYKDNYADNMKNYLELTGQDKKLSTNTESDGRYHSNWLNMMYPRLKLARNLLTDDGVILINMDEHEITNLQKILEEIFGEDNDLGTIIWDKRNPKGDARGIAYQHEYITVFAKNKEFFLSTTELLRPKKNAQTIIDKATILFSYVETGKSTLEEVNKEFSNWVNEQKEFTGGEKAYNKIDMAGSVYQSVSMAWPNKKKAPEEYFIPLIHPITGKECPIPNRGWRNPPQTMKKLLEEDKILFGEDETSQPRRKYLLSENMYENIPSLLYHGGSDVDLLERLGIPFDTPKVTSLCVDHIKSFSKTNDTILDFFSGSATTAHAVMQLNAEDGGNRKYICVQIPEPTPEDSEARKAGYATIPEIAKERIRRAGKKILEEQKAKAEKEGGLFAEEEKKLDTGFKVFKLDSSNINAWDSNPDNLETALNNSLFNIKTDRSEDDLLYEILIKYGIELTEKINSHIIDEKTVYEMGAGSLIVCLADSLSTAVAEGIGKLYKEVSPEGVAGNGRVVFKEAGFNGSDEVKTNTLLILKQHGITNVATV